MKVLFICKHNRFRSKVAEAFFNKYNKNKKHKAKSAGIIKGMPVLTKTALIVKEFGIKLPKETRGVSEKDLYWQNIIVIVADNVPKELFTSRPNLVKKVIVWKIKDAGVEETEKIRNIINQIDKKVKKFVRELK